MSSESPYPLTPSEAADNNLQPFFVLHRARPKETERREFVSGKTRRKIDLSQSSPRSREKPPDSRLEEVDDQHYEKLRFQAFEETWFKIESTIKGVLRQINVNLFDEVRLWILESFAKMKSTGIQRVSDIIRPFPLMSDATCRRIYTALIVTKNTEFVDDLLTFKELGIHLKTNGCHVANLSSIDFMVKHGIGGSLSSLLRQLLMFSTDTADIAILASWYSEPENYDKPVVVIIDDMEQCNGMILAEFLTMLSEWVIKIPIILILGVATTIDAPKKLLPSGVLQYMKPCQFTLGTPFERMNSLIEAVLVKPCSGFHIGYKVAEFLRNYFLRHDGTITSFIRALKIACAKHFSMERLSFLGCGLLDEDHESFWSDKCQALPNKLLGCAFEFPSCQRERIVDRTGDCLAKGLSELRRLQKGWSSVVMCLFEVVKLNKMQLLDVFCEAVDSSNLQTSACHLPSRPLIGGSVLNARSSGLANKGVIAQTIHKVRDIQTPSLFYLLKIWREHTEGMAEIHDKVKELQSILVSSDGDMILEHSPDGHKTLQQKGTRSIKRYVSQSSPSAEKGTVEVKEKAARLLEGMVRDWLKPMERVPFHEIVYFKDVVVLQHALIGDPRRTIQVDILKSQNYIQGNDCCVDSRALSPSMHDTSVMYGLAQEHGDLINLCDWFESFKAIVLGSNTKRKCKMQHSPSPKKVKGTTLDADPSEAMIQARFCRAVTELQITGLLRMPSKRRPDYVQRVAFGF